MQCKKCGNQMVEGDRVCFRCGADTDRGAPAQGAGPPDALIGRVMDDKYRIDAKLGAGGMGTVYRATRLLIGDAVAIKILHAEQVADPQAVERFRREAQAAARLKHPNAVTIYDFGVSNEGIVYLVMELVEGQSLRNIIKQQGPLTPSAAAEVFDQVCAALDEAHRQNIVHRDVKPDNIIVNATASGLRVKVLDFGIAKLRDLSAAAGNLTQTGSVMGTPHYMSPEQCLGEELDSRSDIYSLGIVLYEVLAGVVPFNSPATTAVIVQHVNQAPPSLRTINVSISPAVEAVTLHALAKRRDARPQTAAALAQELTAAVSGMAMATATGAKPLPTKTGVPSPATNTATPSGSMPTMRIETPSWGSGAITPAGTPAPPSEAVVPAKAGRRRTLLWIGIALLLVIAGGATAWLRWPQADKNPSKDAQAAATPTSKPINSRAAPPNMAYVPGGEFLMGSDTGDAYDRPPHKVTVKPFFIDLTEVTCEEYEKFIKATGHRTPPDWTNGRYPPGAARRPVTGVDWDDASAYARWASKRLPSEAEWEFTARGTDGRHYPWGNEWQPGFANADTSAVGHMTDVGAYAAGKSPFGVLDMAGNAWEWTASDLTTYPGGQLPPQKPADLKVIRGGCWDSNRNYATTTIRRGWPARGGNEYDNTGFRCAKDVESPSSAQ